MKNLFCILLLGLMFASCDKKEIVDPLSTSLNLKITKLNSSDNQTYSVNLNEYTNKYSGWNNYGAEGVSIQKSITFNSTLPNGEDIKILIEFSKRESEQLLSLDENITGIVDSWRQSRNWDYISYKDKANSFYTNNSSRVLEINGSNVMFGNKPSINSIKQVTLDVVETEEVRVNGESKTRVTLKIKGDLHPYYSDWSSSEAATYRVEGEFSGIIE